MTRSDRQRWRRWGRWCVDHRLRLLGELLYAMAVADWEADQEWARKRAERRASSVTF